MKLHLQSIIIGIAILFFLSSNYLFKYCVELDVEKKTFMQPTDLGLNGKVLPEYSIMLPDTNKIIKPIDYANKGPIVFLYFDPYCPHCKKQMTEIIQHIQDLKEIKFFFITSFPIQQMNMVIDNLSLTKYDNIIVGRDFLFSFGSYFKITSVPYMVLYGKGGRFISAFNGGLYYKQIVSEITKNNLVAQHR